ncbi:redoxin [Pseudomonas chlororaphis subsp. aurantiaca]|nr:redoxin [Pseudomonas chlororaphis subsp. aurantiaca]
MAKAKIPEWFKIENYDSILTPEKWAVEIFIRYEFSKNCQFNKSLETSEQLEHAFLAMRVDEEKHVEFVNQHTDPFPIKTMSAADMAIISASWSTEKDWLELYSKVCSVVGQQASISFVDEVSEMSMRESINKDAVEKVGWLAPAVCHGVPISINMHADDETLKTAFEIWLAGVRAQSPRFTRKSVSSEDFERWHKFKVLAVFDLLTWSELSGEKVTYSQIANAIWPSHLVPLEDRDTDMTERLRKVAKPLMEQVVLGSTVNSILANLRLERHLDRIVKESMTGPKDTDCSPE